MKKEVKNKLPNEILFCAILFFVVGVLDILMILLAGMGAGAIIFGVSIGIIEIIIGFGLLKMKNAARIAGSIFAWILLVIAAYEIVNALYTNLLYAYRLSIFSLILSIVELILMVLVIKYLKKNKNSFK